MFRFTALIVFGLIGCASGDRGNHIPTKLFQKEVVSKQSVILGGHHKRVTVTGKMGIVMPRADHSYGTIEESESGRIFDMYGKNINLHEELMGRLHGMYDVKKWPIDIRVSGLLESPDFIDGYSDYIIIITDLDQVEQVKESAK